MKIAFDFDETLDRQYIKDIAAKLVADNHDVWIVTSRNDKDGILVYSNHDIHETAHELKIPNEKIIFTNRSPKWIYFKDKDFDIHIDNDTFEVEGIFKNTKTAAICSDYPEWTRIFWNFVLAKKLYCKK